MKRTLIASLAGLVALGIAGIFLPANTASKSYVKAAVATTTMIDIGM